MGSTSDLPIMEKALGLLEEMEIPFEVLALSAHRTPAEVEEFARGAKDRGVKVIIAAAGMAAHLPGVIRMMALAMTAQTVVGTSWLKIYASTGNSTVPSSGAATPVSSSTITPMPDSTTIKNISGL